MDKKVFNNVIVSHGILHRDDLTPIEKKVLVELMAKNGATAGSGGKTYARFFKFGFEKWEIIGIEEIKRQFLKKYFYTDGDNLQCVNMIPLSNIDSIINTQGDFFRLIGQFRGLKSELFSMMVNLGMKSEVTIRKRFLADNWKSYEMKGIESIIDEYCNIDFDKIQYNETITNNYEKEETSFDDKKVSKEKNEIINTNVIVSSKKNVLAQIPISLYKRMSYQKIQKEDTISNLFIEALRYWLKTEVKYDYTLPKGEAKKGIMTQIPKEIYDGLAIRKIKTDISLKEQYIYAVAYWLESQGGNFIF